MKLNYLGHSGVWLETGSHNLLIDPFLTGNPLSSIKPEELPASYILLSHAHGDHLGDTEAIAKRSGAILISNFEIVNHFAAKGIPGHAMNVGGAFSFPFGKVKFTPAWHSNSFPDGSYGGMPMGIVLELEGRRIYHAGDTALFGDMQLIGKGGLDLALLPIGDCFTMGPEDALEAVKLLNPKRVVPIHYNTFDLIKQDAAAFKIEIEQQTQTECVTLLAGESLTI